MKFKTTIKSLVAGISAVLLLGLFPMAGAHAQEGTTGEGGTGNSSVSPGTQNSMPENQPGALNQNIPGENPGRQQKGPDLNYQPGSPNNPESSPENSENPMGNGSNGGSGMNNYHQGSPENTTPSE